MAHGVDSSDRLLPEIASLGERNRRLRPSNLLREVFVADTREEAIRLAQPYLEVKYKTYREWGQDNVMPAGDDFDHGFDELLDDRFLIGSPAQVAERLIDLRRRLGINHLVASLHWPGMPNSLALEQMHILAEEVMPAVRSGA